MNKSNKILSDMKTCYKILILGCIILLALSIVIFTIPITHTVSGTLTDFIYDNGHCIIKIDSTIYSLDTDGMVYVQSKEVSPTGIVYYTNAWVPVISTAEESYYIGWRCQLIYHTTMLNPTNSYAHFTSLIFYNY